MAFILVVSLPHLLSPRPAAARVRAVTARRVARSPVAIFPIDDCYPYRLKDRVPNSGVPNSGIHQNIHKWDEDDRKVGDSIIVGLIGSDDDS